jgi:hypothetical protein
MRRRKRGIAIDPKLMTDAGIMQSMRETIGMVERLRKADRSRETSRRLGPAARQLLRVAALYMGANARIVTAESLAEVTVAVHVIELDAVPAIVQRIRDITPEECGRPPAMVGFEQQFAVAGVSRKRHKLPRPVACERGLAIDIGVDPQTPFRLK